MSSARQVLSALVGVLAAGALAGCAEDNTLSGSVSELFPIEVSWGEVRRNPQALQVSYYRNTAVDVDLVVRLTVDTAALELSPGTRINLAGEVSPGQARTTVVHLAAGEPARVFAPVKAPFSWPNSSLSISDSDTAAQSKMTSGPLARRDRRCRALAAAPLPEPVSPWSSTVESVEPMRCSSAKIFALQGKGAAGALGVQQHQMEALGREPLASQPRASHGLQGNGA